MNNPIHFIDPDGMRVGDFFDKSSNYLGTDGLDDQRNYILTNTTDVDLVKNNTKQNQTTGASSLSAVTEIPSDVTLKESLNVLGRTIANGGLREESSVTLKDGLVVRGETGPMPTIGGGVQMAEAKLPLLPGGYGSVALGELKAPSVDSSDKVTPTKSNGAVIYDRNSNPIIELKKNVIEKILR